MLYSFHRHFSHRREPYSSLKMRLLCSAAFGVFLAGSLFGPAKADPIVPTDWIAGGFSGAWETGANWSNGLPEDATGVTTVTGGTDAIISGVTVGVGGGLEIGNSTTEGDVELRDAGVLNANWVDLYGNTGTDTVARLRLSDANTVANMDSLYVGSSFGGATGNGVVMLQSGSRLNTDSLRIADENGTRGEVHVTGANSLLNVEGDTLYIAGASLVGTNSAEGFLTIDNGGAVIVGGGTGTIRVATTEGSTGRILIGSLDPFFPQAPGSISASAIIFGGAGGQDGELVFNHTSNNYEFAPSVSGDGSIHVEAGNTTLTGASTHTGGTFITGGTLQGDTDSLTGDIHLNGGNLIFDMAENGTFDGSIFHDDPDEAGWMLLRGTGGIIYDSDVLMAQSLYVESSGNVIDGTEVTIKSNLQVSNALEGRYPTDAGLTIQNGATVTSDSGRIGDIDEFDASVTVTGARTSWTIATEDRPRQLRIRGRGASTLNVLDGAHVSVWGETSIESSSGGDPASLNVTGAGSQFSTSGSLIIGNEGTGHMTISDGGSVISGESEVGNLSPRTGIVHIDGEGSFWQIDDANLTVGGSHDEEIGVGHITLSNGGSLALVVTMDEERYGSIRAAMGEGSTARMNIGAAEGEEAAAAGSIEAKELVLGDDSLGSAHLVFNHTDEDYEFETPIVGTGEIRVFSGVTTLTGDSRYFAGETEIISGSLIVNGVLGGALSMSGGGELSLLGGSGRVRDVSVQRGATLAPGNSIGTLTVAGDLEFGDLSTFWVEVNDGGNIAGVNSDLLLVEEAATIDEGASVWVSPANGTDTGETYAADTTYRILTASSVTGAFGSVDSDFAFLTPELSYDATNVYLTLSKSADFEEVAQTGNQRNIARILEGFGSLSAFYNQILTMNEEEAREAFDALTGEAHASSFQSFFQVAGQVRQKILNRLQQLLGGFRTAQFSDYAPAAGDEIAVSGEVWGQVFGGWGSSDGNSVSAAMDRDTYGFLAGIDRDIGQDTRIGVAAGYSRSTYDVPSRSSSGESDNLHLAAYAGTKWAGFDFKSALSYGLQMSDSQRHVVVGLIVNHLETDYNAHSFQGTFEVSRDFDMGSLVVAPFAGLSVLHVETEGFTETGGPAALTMASTSHTLETSTVGLRFNQDISNVTLNGELGWRHMFGDLSPASTAAFASAPAQSFTITGAPLARNVFVIGAGADVEFDNGTMLMVGYAGEFSSETRDHGLRAELRFSF